MTTPCALPTCDEITLDQHVCQKCINMLHHQVLDNISWILTDLDLVITRQVRTTSSLGIRTPTSRPLPVNLKAADVKHELENELTTSARIIADDNDWPLDITTPTQAAIWLALRLPAVARHPAAADIIDGITRHYSAALWVIDRHEPAVTLGICHETSPTADHCPGIIRAKTSQKEARCNTCGNTWDADELWEWTFSQARNRLVTAAEFAALSAFFDLGATRERVRKRVNLWAHRGQITRHGHIDGTPTFRLGDLVDLSQKQPDWRVA